MKWKLPVAAALLLTAAQAENGFAQEQVPSTFNSQFLQQVSLDQLIEDLQPGYVPYQPASWLQNQANQPGTATGQSPNPTPRPNPQPPANPLANMQNRRPTLARMSRAPDLFGDSFTPLTVGVIGSKLDDLGVTSTNLNGNYEANIPVGAGTRRFKNEQTRALPTDRVIFVYNHFHNAVELKHFSGAGPQSDVENVDQYTIGFEKTFGDGLWSVEARMPFAGDSDLAVTDIGIDSGHVGNLAITLKRLLYSDDDVALAAGLAVTAPTGSDTHFNIANGAARITVENEAVHLLPYLGLLTTPADDWFVHAFAQVDVAANGNGLSYFTPIGFPTTLNGAVTEQTLMYLDLSIGHWWYRSDEDDGLTGLASVIEFHYTTSLNDAHSSDLGGVGFFNLGNGFNRFDVVNMTVGLHTEWSTNTAIRTALVVPLGNEEDRFFDSELQLSIIQRF